MNKYLIFSGMILILLSVFAANNLANIPTGAMVYKGECTLIVDDGRNVYEQQVQLKNSSAFDVLKSMFEVEYDAGEYGVFIKGIKTENWTRQTTDYFWMYFVNGKLADVAADKYAVKPGDTIKFAYMSSADAMKFFG